MSVNSDTDKMFNDNDFSPSFLLATAEIAEKLERQHQSSQSRAETVIEGETISIGLSDGEEYYSNDHQEHATSDDKVDSSVPILSQDNSPTTEYRLSPVEASFIEEDDHESFVMVEKESIPEHVSETNQVPEKEDQEMKDAPIEDDVEMEAAAEESVKSKPVTPDNAAIATQEVTKETMSVDTTVQTEQAPVQETNAQEKKTSQPEETVPQEDKEGTKEPTQPEEKAPKETEKTPEEKERENTIEQHTDIEKKEDTLAEKQSEEEKQDDAVVEKQAEEEKQEVTVVEKETEQEKEGKPVVEEQAESSKQDDTPQKQDISKPTEEALMEIEETATEPKEPEEMNNDTSPLDEDKENRIPPKVTAEEIPEPQDIEMAEQEEEEIEYEEEEPKKKSVSPVPEKEDTTIEEAAPETEEVNSSEDEDGENEEYEVEAIRSHKTYRDKVIKYVIKWKGWPEDDNTTELSETIHADVPDICTEYWSNLKLKAVPSNVKQFVNKRSATPEPAQKHKATPEPINKRKATPEASAPTKRARKAAYTVKKHEVARKLINVGFVIPSTEEWPNTLDDWEGDIASIHSVQPSDKDETKLLAYLIWNNGKKTIHLLKDIHNKCPKKMIDYYEGRLRFYK